MLCEPAQVFPSSGQVKESITAAVTPRTLLRSQSGSEPLMSGLWFVTWSPWVVSTTHPRMLLSPWVVSLSGPQPPSSSVFLLTLTLRSAHGLFSLVFPASPNSADPTPSAWEEWAVSKPRQSHNSVILQGIELIDLPIR